MTAVAGPIGFVVRKVAVVVVDPIVIVAAVPIVLVGLVDRMVVDSPDLVALDRDMVTVVRPGVEVVQADCSRTAPGDTVMLCRIVMRSEVWSRVGTMKGRVEGRQGWTAVVDSASRR